MAKTLADFVAQDELAGLRQTDLNAARGLPAAVYIDDDFFQLEQRQLFPTTWVSVAFASDIPNTGDAMPLTVSGLPIILVRDQQQQIRAFHNVCRHRATIVLEQPCSGLSTFKCPYHGWVYGLDGRLKATPFWDGTPETSKIPVIADQNSLVPIACDVWNHVIFINLDGQAPPLLEYLAPMEAELAHLDMDALEVGYRMSWDFQANWKLVMENWEVYHHVWVHEGVFDKMSDEVDLNTGEPYTDMIADGNSLMLRAKPTRPPRKLTGPASRLPELPTKAVAQDIVSTANAVLPNTTVTIGPVAYAPAIYTPIAPGITRASMAWYFAPGAATGEQYKAGREAIYDRWLGPNRDLTERKGIRPQDHRCMELQQAARRSPVANDVKFSTVWESNVRYFQDWVVRHLGG